MENRDFTTEYKWWENLEKRVKLEQAFAIGCTDEEACSYAEITPDQLYYYENNIDKEFRVKKQEMKKKPILKAKQTVVKSLDDPKNAQWYLEKRAHAEFGNKLDINAEVTKKIISIDE